MMVHQFAVVSFMSLALYLSHNVAAAYKVIRFSGGGVFFFWQVGAAAYLQEHCADLQQLPVMGASAGSIAATMMAVGISFDDIVELCIDIADEHQVWEKKNGLTGEWGRFLRIFLSRILPEEIHQDVLGRINILVTPTNLVKGPKLLSNFVDKSDLIEAILTSTHIPLFMDGRPWTTYKDEQYFDGSFWSLLAKVKGPWPVASIDTFKDVFHVDQNHDVRFISQLDSKAILRLLDPDSMYDMIQSGYEYMETLAYNGKLPIRAKLHSFPSTTGILVHPPVFKEFKVSNSFPTMEPAFTMSSQQQSESIKMKVSMLSVATPSTAQSPAPLPPLQPVLASTALPHITTLLQPTVPVVASAGLLCNRFFQQLRPNRIALMIRGAMSHFQHAIAALVQHVQQSIERTLLQGIRFVNNVLLNFHPMQKQWNKGFAARNAVLTPSIKLFA